MGELGGRVEPSPRAGEGGRSGTLMALLEERVASLVERHRESRKTIAELQTQLEESGTRLEGLTRELEAGQRLRTELLERVTRLIQRIDALERAEAEESA